MEQCLIENMRGKLFFLMLVSDGFTVLAISRSLFLSSVGCSIVLFFFFPFHPWFSFPAKSDRKSLLDNELQF